MTAQTLYNKLNSGEISKNKFLYEIRRQDLPGITKFNSFEDTVRILKNRSIISEKKEKNPEVPGVDAPTIDMVSPYEYSKGINYELDLMQVSIIHNLPTEEEMLKAQKKVLKNLGKDQYYYSRKLMSPEEKKQEKANEREYELKGKLVHNNKKGIIRESLEGLESYEDGNGVTISKGDMVRIPGGLTTDPINKQGEEGVIKFIDEDGTVYVLFDDGLVGAYSDGVVEPIEVAEMYHPEYGSGGGKNEYQGRSATKLSKQGKEDHKKEMSDFNKKLKGILNKKGLEESNYEMLDDPTEDAFSLEYLMNALTEEESVGGVDEELEIAKDEAQRISKEEGVAQHVNKVGNGYRVEDFYDSESTVASFEDGRPLNEEAETETDEEWRRIIEEIIGEWGLQSFDMTDDEVMEELAKELNRRASLNEEDQEGSIEVDDENQAKKLADQGKNVILKDRQ